MPLKRYAFYQVKPVTQVFTEHLLFPKQLIKSNLTVLMHTKFSKFSYLDTLEFNFPLKRVFYITSYDDDDDDDDDDN